MMLISIKNSRPRRGGLFLSILLIGCLSSPASSQNWQEVDELVGTDAALGVQFGISVALQGRLALVGANLDSEFDTGAGAAYFFSDIGGSGWQQLTKVVADDSEESDAFGSSVGLNREVAFVGAPGDNGSAGSVYTFDATGAWSQQDRIEPNDVEPGDQFGYSVSLGGNRALIGSPSGNKDSLSDVGAAYIFANAAGDWQEVAKLTADDAAAGEFDQFGSSVSLDNNLALVGAWLDSEGGSNAGAAYLFADDGLGNWSQVAKFTASDAQPDDNFGFAVSLLGEFALIGAPFGDSPSDADVGAAYLFQDVGGGNWQEVGKLTASDAAAFDLDQFGASVGLGAGIAIVGAPFDSDGGFAAGAGYIFEYDSGIWTELQKLTANNAVELDLFGGAVAMYGNGAVIGALGANAGSGSAYVFANDGVFLDADFNEDQDVDGLDLDQWDAAYGTQYFAAHIDGDADGDGDVDGLDFLTWQRQVGQTSVVAAPEPSSALFGVVSTALILLRRRVSSRFQVRLWGV